MPSRCPGATWGPLPRASWRARPRVVTVPFAAAHAVGACAEVWARLRRKPGIVSREKIAEARCMAWTCDTARAALELGFVAPTSLDEGLAATLAWYKEAGWLTY